MWLMLSHAFIFYFPTHSQRTCLFPQGLFEVVKSYLNWGKYYINVKHEFHFPKQKSWIVLHWTLAPCCIIIRLLLFFFLLVTHSYLFQPVSVSPFISLTIWNVSYYFVLWRVDWGIFLGGGLNILQNTPFLKSLVFKICIFFFNLKCSSGYIRY